MDCSDARGGCGGGSFLRRGRGPGSGRVRGSGSGVGVAVGVGVAFAFGVGVGVGGRGRRSRSGSGSGSRPPVARRLHAPPRPSAPPARPDVHPASRLSPSDLAHPRRNVLEARPLLRCGARPQIAAPLEAHGENLDDDARPHDERPASTKTALLLAAKASSVIVALAAVACTANVGNEPVATPTERGTSPESVVVGGLIPIVPICLVANAEATLTLEPNFDLQGYFSPLNAGSPGDDAGFGVLSPANYQSLNCLGQYVVQLNTPSWLPNETAKYDQGGIVVSGLAEWPAGAACANEHIDFAVWGENASNAWTEVANDSRTGCSPHAYEYYFQSGYSAASLTEYKSFWVQTDAYVLNGTAKTYAPVFVSGAVVQLEQQP